MRKSTKILTTIGAVMVIYAVFFFPVFNKQQYTAGAFSDDLAMGVGAELQVATSVAQVKPSVNSALLFEQNRDGFSRSQEVRDKLVDLETRTLNGQLRNVSSSEIGACLASAFQSTIAALSDAQIDQATTLSFWQYPARPYPPIADSDLTDRPALLWPETGDVFVFGVSDLARTIKEYRDGSTAESLIWRAQTSSLFANRIKTKLGEIQNVVSSWGSGDSVSPVRAFLLAYHVMADDPLGGSHNDWTAYLQGLEDNWVTQYGISRQSDKKPFGENGYIYRAPISLYFDDATVLYFLKLVETKTQ